MRIQLHGIEQAIANLAMLPKRVAFRHLRVALSAAGGRIAGPARALAPVRFGYLSKSLGVKVKIPDASWDIKHHGKPAYVLIGPKRRQGRFIKTKTGRNFAKANQLLRQTREQLVRTGAGGKAKLRGLVKERLAVKLTTGKGISGVKYINPSRYAHLAEKRRPYLGPASRIAAPQAAAAAAEKLAKAFEVEAAALPKTISTGGLALAG